MRVLGAACLFAAIYLAAEHTTSGDDPLVWCAIGALVGVGCSLIGRTKSGAA
jgi:hypothetical protein